MRFNLPFGYDAVGKIDRELQDGHNYRIAWHELEIENVSPINAPVATRWKNGETIYLNGRHYARPSHVRCPSGQAGRTWLNNIFANDLAALEGSDLSQRPKIPALELVIGVFNERHFHAFDEYNIKRRESKHPQLLWSNVDERRAEVETLSDTLILVEDQVLIAVNEPVYRVSTWKDKATIDIVLSSPTTNKLRRYREQFLFFRADRFDDALDYAHRGARIVDIKQDGEIEVLIPNSIQAFDDLHALIEAAKEALELGKGFVLETLSTEQAITWMHLRDTVMQPMEQLDRNDLLLEQLSAWLVVLRTLPFNWSKRFESICQQIERWQMRPITSARAR